MKKCELQERGITLIALVVTIIIVLILAGVSIQLAINKGLFDNANKAKIDFQRAQVTEMLSLKLTGEQIKNPAGSSEELVEATRKSASEDEELKKMGKKVTVDPKTSTEEDGKIVDVYFYVEVDKDVYKVDKTGARFIGEKGKFPPVVIIESMTTTSNSIKLKLKTSRNEEGQIEIYKKSKEDADFVSVKTGKNEEMIGTEQIISGLKQNETYSIKIVATATNEQTAEVTQDVTIGSVPNLTTADITFTYTTEGKEITETTWTNKDVTVTASTKIQGYELQTSKDGHTWSSEPSQIFEKNETMYVVLYDGVNYGGSATANIRNIDKKEPKDLTPSMSIVDDNLVVDASGAEDEEETEEYGQSGISKIYFSEDNEETWQLSNDKEAISKKYICEKINSERENFIKLKLVDEAGNEKITKSVNLDDYAAIITFYANNKKDEMKTIAMNKGETLQILKNTFTKEDSEFYGWNANARGSGEYYLEESELTVNGKLSFFAMWNKKTAFYNQNISELYVNGASVKPNINSYSSGNFGCASAILSPWEKIGGIDSKESSTIAVPNVIVDEPILVQFMYGVPWNFCSITNLSSLLLNIDGKDYCVNSAIEDGYISELVLWNGGVANRYISDMYGEYPDAKNLLFGKSWNRAGGILKLVFTPIKACTLQVKTVGNCGKTGSMHGCYTYVYRGVGKTLSATK